MARETDKETQQRYFETLKIARTSGTSLHIRRIMHWYAIKTEYANERFVNIPGILNEKWVSYTFEHLKYLKLLLGSLNQFRASSIPQDRRDHREHDPLAEAKHRYDDIYFTILSRSGANLTSTMSAVKMTLSFMRCKSR